jgi:hypothetical protein
MEPNPLEPAALDRRAQRARTLLVILTLVFIVAPFVIYLLSGRGGVPRQ